MRLSVVQKILCSVMISVHCQCDRIKNHPRDGPLGMPVQNSLDCTELGDSLDVGGTIP